MKSRCHSYLFEELIKENRNPIKNTFETLPNIIKNKYWTIK